MAKKSIESFSRVSSKTKAVPIVAIGASAGGLEAMSKLLRNLPDDTGFAFVYVQHLDPTHESGLSDILKRHTAMKVQEAEHLMRITQNQLYVIPPNKNMECIDGVLTIDQRKARPIPHRPIDQFFISLAERQGDTAIGVLLSGNGTDGTLGMKSIKTAGGITIVQDMTAKYPSMPQSSVEEGVADAILPPERIADALVHLGKQMPLISAPAVEVDQGEKTRNLQTETDLQSILYMLKKSSGVDFSNYKVSTVLRRIRRRMLLNKVDSLHQYVDYLKRHAAESNLLYNDLLINVTSFFRDEDTLRYLKNTLFPNLLRTKADNDSVRIWVPACSTGEECYSLAIVLAEALKDKAEHIAIQLFATDLSESAIAKARQGVYNESEVAKVSAERLKRFFTKVEKGYRIVKSIRDRCVFAPHNIIKAPPFARLDLISCCNLFIYMNPVLQKKVLSIFHYALNPNGHLVLGKSETIGPSTIFSPVDKKLKVYVRKQDGPARSYFELPHFLPFQKGEKPAPNPVARIPVHPVESLEKTVDSLLLQHYVSPNIVVNQDLDILQFRGSTGLFLEPAAGKASLNLLKMARPELVFELRNAVSKAAKSGRPVQKGGLQIKVKEKTYRVSLEVVPLQNNAAERFFLILFTENPPPAPPETAPHRSDRRVELLETELNSLRNDLRSIIEEHEASNEELQSANEEIVSTNEELQSLNEELETSKEEIEATNEELMATNQELQVRNQELIEVQEFSEAVLLTLRESFIVLDHHLKVKSANKVFYNTFHTTKEETEGRMIYDLGDGQWDIPKLRNLLKTVLSQNSNLYDFEVVHIFPGIGEKVMLLNAYKLAPLEFRSEMIILAIEDVTELRRAQQQAAFQDMANNAPVMMWVAGTDKRFSFVNNTWLEFTGHTMDMERGSGWQMGLHPDDLIQYNKTFNSYFNRQEAFRIEYRLRRKDGVYRWLLDAGKPSFSPSGEFAGYIGSCTDIHEQKMANEELNARVQERTRELSEAIANLERSNQELQQFAYIASHDLQEPLRKIMTFADRLQKRLGEALPLEGKDYLIRINSATKRMSALIEDLLNFSRLSRQEKIFYETDLNDIFATVLVDFDLLITQKNARITVAPLPKIQAIPLQMKQLFSNLLSNALKFSSPDRPPEIDVSGQPPTDADLQRLRNGGDPAAYVKITVRDNGIGFDPEYAEKIFEIFQRLHDKQQYAGTGIGLAICRRIVENHGGEIWAESGKGKGAAFQVMLPLEQGG